MYRNKATKTYGRFNRADDLNYPFPRLLGSFIDRQDGNRDFVSFTRSIMKLLEGKITGKRFATGGHLVFCLYSEAGCDYLLIAMVKNRDGVTFTQDLDIADSIHIDLDKLHQAARISLPLFQADEDDKNCLSFIKGKTKEVTEYFHEALACTDIITSLTVTRNVIKALNAFIKQEEISREEGIAIRAKVVGYLDEQRASKQPASLAAISDLIDRDLPPEKRDKFSILANSEEYQVSEEFEPNRNALMQAKRVIHNTAHWKLQFDRKALGSPDSNAEIIYDSEQGTLTFTQVPDDLKKELDKILSDECY